MWTLQQNLLTSAREVLECVGKFTFESKEQPTCITEHCDCLPLTHKAVLQNVSPLLTGKEMGRNINGAKISPKTSKLLVCWFAFSFEVQSKVIMF